LVTLLDDAGIKRAVVLSTAYFFFASRPGRCRTSTKKSRLTTSRVWFDVTAVVPADVQPDIAARIAARIRQLGVRRVLYGSDAPTGGNLVPQAGWAAFRKLPLTEGEFRTIARNVPPYLPR
jgi:hypothetical protein